MKRAPAPSAPSAPDGPAVAGRGSALIGARIKRRVLRGAGLLYVSRPWAFALAAVLALAACGGPAGDPARGQELYRQASLPAGAPGCTTCHSLEPGQVKVGPSHAGVGARAERIVSDPAYSGQAATAAEYLRESILDPDAYVVEGFEPGIMYARYESALSDQQIDDVVAFLLTLR